MWPAHIGSKAREPVREYSQTCLQQYYSCVQESSGQRRQFSSASARKGWQAQPFSMPASTVLGQKTNLMSSEVFSLAPTTKTPWVKCQS